MQTRERQSTAQFTTVAQTPDSIVAICLSGQWRKVTDGELVQFALGEAHSPIMPPRLYPALRYREGTRVVTTPLSSIEGYEFGETQ